MKMINTKVVITVTALKQNIKFSKVKAFVKLNTISKPNRGLHIKDLAFSFYTNPDYILEDGLWQFSSYISNNPPDEVENEFDLDTCNEFRTELGNYLDLSEVYYRLILNEDLTNYKNIMLVDKLCKQVAYDSITKSPFIKLITQ